MLGHNENWAPKNCSFELWCWRRLLRDPWTSRSNQSILKEISPEYAWKDWCWSWNSNTLATWCEELTHRKRSWCWEILKTGGEGNDRGWDGWMTSPTQWTWVWASSESWWWTGKPGVLQSMGSQRVRHDWTTELTDWSIWHIQLTPFSMKFQDLSGYLKPHLVWKLTYSVFFSCTYITTIKFNL